MGNEALVDAFSEAFQEELARLRKRRRRNDTRLCRELQAVERGIKRCLTFITGGDGDPGLVRDELRDLEERKQQIERDLNNTMADAVIEVHPNIVELYRRKVEDLQALLLDESTRPEAVEIIRSMIERIDVHPGEKRGECDVILIGALARILAFTQQQQTAASGGDSGTFLMVAGARNHLYRTFMLWVT